MKPDLTVSRGNPPKRPTPVRDVLHEPAAKPEWLAKHLLACRAWDELAPACVASGLLIALTQEAFAHLCFYIGEFRSHPTAMRGPHRTDMRALMRAFQITPTRRALVRPVLARSGAASATGRRSTAAKGRQMRDQKQRKQ